jgi:hypothetical protein
VTAVINPQRSGPGAGLPQATAGTRYLLTAPTGSIINTATGGPNVGQLTDATAWTNNGVALVANANDVIQYDGSIWYVDFNSQFATETQFLTNLTTSVQYRYDPAEQMWVKSYEGYYDGGEWSLVL